MKFRRLSTAVGDANPGATGESMDGASASGAASPETFRRGRASARGGPAPRDSAATPAVDGAAGVGAAIFLGAVLDASSAISEALAESAGALERGDTQAFAAAQLAAIEGSRKLAALWEL